MAKGDTLAKNAGGSLETLAIGTDGKVLMADAASTLGVKWETVSGTGDVVGPAGATDHALPRFNTATGKLIQDSVITVADTTGALSINGHQALTDPTGSPTNKFLRDDGTWQTVSAGSLNGPPNDADFIVWNDSGTYKAYDPLTNAVDYSNADFSTMMASLLSGEADEVVIRFRPGTYSVATSIQIAGSALAGTRLIGSGEDNTIFQATASLGTTGIIDGRATNLQIEGITFDANSQATTVGVALGAVPGDGYGAYRQSLTNCVIKNATTEALRIRDQAYYYNIDNVRMMDGNAFGIHFFNDTGAAGDNGQTQITNCEVSGTGGCIKATTTAATRHRILIQRCGFYDTASGTYMVDLSGMYEVELNSCDFEGSVSGAPSGAMLRVVGSGVLVSNCQFFGRTDYSSKIAITSTDAGTGTFRPPIFINPRFISWDASCTAFDIQTGEFIVVGPEISADCENGFKLYSSTSHHRACVYDVRANPDKATVNEDFIGRALNPYVWNTGDSETGASVGIITGVSATAQGGICQFSTGATINTNAILNMDGTMPMAFSYHLYARIIGKLSSASDVKVFFGQWQDANNYVGFRLDTSVSSNWYYVCRAASVETAASTGIAADTNFNTFEFYQDPKIVGTSGYRFFINSAQVGTCTTNNPSGICEPRVDVENLAASDKQFNLDLFFSSNRRPAT